MSKFLEVLANDGKEGFFITINYDEILLVIESDEGTATVVLKNGEEYDTLTSYNIIIKKLANLTEVETI